MGVNGKIKNFRLLFERVYKPDSVSKRLWLFILKDFYKSFLATYPRNIAENQSLFLLFGLAPSGVCTAIYIAINAVSSYLTISTLPQFGGIFSVALSLRLPSLDVIQHFFSVESGLSSV